MQATRRWLRHRGNLDKASLRLFVAGAAVATAVPALRAQSLNDPALQVLTWVAGLSQPTSIALLPQLPGQPLEALVDEKATGRVMHVRGGALVGPVLDLAVNSRSERGLLGMALHPDFASNGFVYLYYSASSTGLDNADQDAIAGHRVERYHWDGTSLSAPAPILALPGAGGPNHDGGILLFGPDRKLYGVLGDLNHRTQLQNLPAGPPPDDTSIIFRIDDDGSVPADNPFLAFGGSMPKVFAYGVRNCFGLDFDPRTGVLWDTENGPDAYDEINRVPAGFNSGWVQIMGPDGRDPQGLGDVWVAPGSHYGDPLFSWLGPIGVTSLHFIRSSILGAAYENDLLVGDNNFSGLYHFELSGDRSSLVMTTAETTDRVADNELERDVYRLGSSFGVITDIETGPDGVYVCSLSLGRILRLRRNPAEVQASDWGRIKELYRPK